MSPRADAEQELPRVLAMIPWLVANRGASKEVVAARFGITLTELERDLRLMMMVGVPPYSPGDYITVDADDDTVDVWLAPHFERALRLSPAEGLAVLAAGRALLAVPGSDPAGPLATALDKLAGALGGGEVAVTLGTPPLLEAVRKAAEAGDQLEIEYWSAGRNDITVRRIDPGPAFFALGHWYTDAYCHLREGTRMFRVDRIRAATPTGEHFAPTARSSDEAVYRPLTDDPRVTLEIPASASWVAETYPTESVEDLSDGRLRVVLAVSEEPWLERLLLRVGPEATVTSPAEWRDVGARAAKRVAARYRASGDPSPASDQHVERHQ